jgi:SAM-dependent methyltransferase
MAYHAKLRCPVCKGLLSTGTDLRCRTCSRTYPIVDGIPVMLADTAPADGEQNLDVEKDFYESMFAGLRGLEDGHCIVYGHDQIYDFVSELERGTVLEAGCGAGHHGVSLAKRGFEVTSIDLTLNGVRQAKKLAAHEQQDILYVCGDIKQLPFKDKEFDICFCSLVLHHFVSLDNLLRELARVTKRYFVAFEVNAWDPISFVRFNVINPTIGYRNISKNQRALFPENISATLRRNGFNGFVLKYDDMHEYVGKAPDSVKAKMIVTFQKAMGLLPERFSNNKFLLRAERQAS